MSRKLDAWIHTELLGKTLHTPEEQMAMAGCCFCKEPAYYENGHYGKRVVTIPRYSEDIASACMVVEKMGVAFTLEDGLTDTGREWFASLGCLPVRAATAPLAICLACYRAKTGEEWREEE